MRNGERFRMLIDALKLERFVKITSLYLFGYHWRQALSDGDGDGEVDRSIDRSAAHSLSLCQLLKIQGLAWSGRVECSSCRVMNDELDAGWSFRPFSDPMVRPWHDFLRVLLKPSTSNAFILFAASLTTWSINHYLLLLMQLIMATNNAQMLPGGLPSPFIWTTALRNVYDQMPTCAVCNLLKSLMHDWYL